MTDTLTKAERSRVMSRIRSKGMKPEMTVRRWVHALGYRYRLHAADLPGKPDLVFRSRHKEIFIHGCFWHWHLARSCGKARMPSTRTDFWRAKLEGNKARDQRTRRRLTRLGWKSLVIWECELGNRERIERRIIEFLDAE